MIYAVGRLGQSVVASSGSTCGMLKPMSETTPLAAHLLDALEELEDIRAYDEAKASDDEVIPFEQAMQEIEQSRR
jgi:hypothetical protein